MMRFQWIIPQRLRLPGLGLALLVAIALAIGAPAVSAQDPGGRVCAAAFNDANHNGAREAMEPLLADVVVSLLNEQSIVVATYVTTGQNEPHCFEGLAAGTYIVAFAGATVTPTGSDSVSVTLAAGQLTPAQVLFGATPGALPTAAPTRAAAGNLLGSDTVLRIALAVVGAAFIMVLLAIVGLLIYWRRFGNRPPARPASGPPVPPQDQTWQG